MLDFRWILEALPVGVWVAHVPSGQVAHANPEFRNIMGMNAVAGVGIDEAPVTYGICDLAGRPYPVDRLPFSRVVATGKPVMVDDLVIHRSDGRLVNVRAFAYPLRTAGDDLTHVLVAFVDITAELTAEADRRQTKSWLTFAVDHAPIVIWSTDREGVITLSQGAGLAALGVRSGELLGQNVFERYKDQPTVSAAIRRALGGDSFWYTVQVGEAVYETWIAPTRDAAGQIAGVAALSNDVSAVRRLQASAIQNDRIIALGTLAASVAHEINNPLTYMLGHLSMLSESIARLDEIAGRLDAVEPGDFRGLVRSMHESLDLVRGGTERIAGITSELRTFSRPTSDVSDLEVNAPVISVLKLLGKELESRARIHVRLQATAQVKADMTRLVQVVLNLVVNAMQALPADRAQVNQIWVSTADRGDQVVIEIADNGPGVPPEDRERIFEPFLTTRDVGDGSGLGLFVCRNIVSAWAGTVSVDERLGGGACFTVALPAVQTPSIDTRHAARRSASRRVNTPGGHVLIVDDEPAVAGVLAAQLEIAGYQVTLETEGERALERLLNESEPVDLVYCDLMMKGMSGMDLAEALGPRAPKQLARTVFMTGGAFTARARDFRVAHAERCVDKPFDIVAETARRLAGSRQ